MTSGNKTDLAKEECTTAQYGSTFLSNMYQFYQEEYLWDFSIKVDGRTFKVHKLAVASCSDYFKAVFSHDMLEKRQEFVELKSLSVKGVEPLIKYAYTGTVELTLENIHDVISAATFLQITSAVELCITYLEKKMTFENADDLLHIGEMLSIPVLKEHYRQYILDNFIAFSETESFLNLNSETLIDYLVDDKLRTPSELTLLQAVIGWFEHDSKNREEIAADVFDKIRYVIDGKSALDYAAKTEPFISNPKCQEILDFGLKYLENPEKKYTYFDHRTRVRFNRKCLVQYGGVRMNDFDMNEMFIENRIGCNKHAFYHADAKLWFALQKADRHQNVCDASVIEVNDCAIISGGCVCRVVTENEILTHSPVLSLATKRVCVFYPADKTFCDIDSLQHERKQHASVYISGSGTDTAGVGSLYAIGGKDDMQSLGSVEKMDCQEGKWKYVKPLPKPLYDHAATVVQGKIYVSGGIESHKMSTNIWCYSPDVNKWHKKANMNISRAGHAMVSIDNCLYVCGGYCRSGYLSGNTCLNSLEKFSIKTKQWTSLDYMLHPVSDISKSVCILNGKIIVAGGEGEDGELANIIQQYDPEENKWSVYGRLFQPMKGVGLCALTIDLFKVAEENKPMHNVYTPPFSPFDHLDIEDDYDGFYYDGTDDDDESVDFIF